MKELMPSSLNATLDRVESHLPLLPRQVFRLQRAITSKSVSALKSILRAVDRSSDRVEKSATTGVNTVTGQAKAQAKQTTTVARDEASSLLDRATRSVEGNDTERLDAWTKADLYQRAQELDIQGRSTMSKSQLVSALRTH